ncbi:MAG: LamG domain-containing protein [Verrucomicrobiaceae bacterium]|nr:LamG domain-containing protein [Verrucomicrobiaceae bacterium]
MRSLFLFAFLFTGLTAQELRLQQPWSAAYSGTDVTGSHVLGHWSFDDEAVNKTLVMRGAEIVKSGRFGSGLRSQPGFPIMDKSHGVQVTSKDKSLSPKGAFTLELWACPSTEFKAELRAYLLDKKYVDQTDYQWLIASADKSGKRRMHVVLGFGSDSETWFSDPVDLLPDEWHHLAFVYDGNGTGRFLRDGQSAGTMTHAGRKGIAPGAKALSIGDRLGSNYSGFPGMLDEVRVCDAALNYERVMLDIKTQRTVFRRMETARPFQIQVDNLQRVALKGAELHVITNGIVDKLPLPEIAAGKSYTSSYPINTSLKPDSYGFTVMLKLPDYETTKSLTWEIVARSPVAMPVIMWGAGFKNMDQLKELGFNQFIGLGAGGAPSAVWKDGKPALPNTPEAIQETRGNLDLALKQGLSVAASMSPKEVPMKDDGFKRVDRKGQPLEREDILASRPELPAFFENVGRSVAQAYGDHPAFVSALINTEVRDHSAPSFTTHDFEHYRKFANADIPAEVTSRWGINWSNLKDFPADRVLPDDHPILKYYRWFWTVGDGWNGLHTALSKGVKAGNSDVWTWFDPAVRQPPISGAGGQVDVLSHWTYTYPAPLSIGLCADQLFAMSAASGRAQRVMKMTQLIWYRSQTAPIKPGKPDETVAWDDHDPDAAYITIAPQHLREAFWTKIARPVQGIMYHGWNSLVDEPGNTSAYRFTHGSTQYVLKDLLHHVLRPLGPALMQIPDERSEVAYLESFTSGVFAARNPYGNNNGWAADLWLALQHAHVQTDVLFEENLLKSGLGGRKWLIMPHCDVLTAPVVTKIADWQKRGGKILADEFLCPGLKADVAIPSFKRTKNAKVDKQAVLDLAKKLPVMPTKAVCDNPEIVLRVRKAGEALYVFAVNDHREAGTYVGHHSLVMENGLPSSGTITVPVEGANVYDLVSGKFVVPQRSADGGFTSWKLELGPCDGRIFMVVPKPLLALKVDASESVKRGNQVTVTAAVHTVQDQLMKATVPLEVEVLDATGRKTEGSGFYAAAAGQIQIKLDIASNEEPGFWQVRVRELASQMEVTKYIRVDL